MEHRALDYLNEFPYIPKGSINNTWYSKNGLSKEKFMSIKAGIISEYNRLTKIFDPDNIEAGI